MFIYSFDKVIKQLNAIWRTCNQCTQKMENGITNHVAVSKSLPMVIAYLNSKSHLLECSSIWIFIQSNSCPMEKIDRKGCHNEGAIQGG